MSTSRKHAPSSRIRRCPNWTCLRFDYGDWNPANNTDGTPFVQMISTTDSTTMWADFYTNRTATLAQLPLPLDPASIIYYASRSGSTPDNSTATTTTSPTTTSSSSTGATQAPATLAANLSGAVSTDGTSSASTNGSWGDKYGNVVLGLLAANLAIGVALLVAVLTMCGRRRKERNGPSLRYAPVLFKEPVED